MNTYASISAPILAAFPGLTPGDLIYTAPPKPDMGDLALRTFEAAKKLGMAPPQLAAAIAEKAAFGPEVRDAFVAGPYLNFRLDRGALGRGIVAAVFDQGAHYGSNASGRGKRALIEHTSINPNASPHVGRARNAMIGDALVRLLRFEEYDVEVHYYVNDMGRQIGLLVLVCEDPASMTFDRMLDAYVQANQRAEADPEFAEAGYALLAKMEEGDAATKEKFHAVTDLCLQGQLAVLARLGISYDCFDRESDFVRDPRLDSVLEALRAQDAVFVDEDKRLVVDLGKIGHAHPEGRYFVLMRANGSSMYGYRDIAYSIEKMERAADLNLMVLGEDHKLYAQQIELILKAAGFPAAEAVYYSYILLREGKMSTRQGKVVLLSEFLDEAQARAAEKVNEQCRDLPPEERRAIAEKVAVAAVRFAILRVGPNKNVIFDWETSLSFTGDTGPYIQYSCARISSILRKFGEVPREIAPDFPIATDAEWALLGKIASFDETVAMALEERTCAPIAQFALDAARLFTSFYHECPVLDAATPAQRVARAQLCAATRQALENALALLGIHALERM
ncbi:MAG TPA: arginine--tRNA ligase [Candidatus Hydrogenedentes bacterium]|nr:arginine--tRNA ligase [Candidatus Hydrogenedentota bacterium]HOS02077.1 arginine--tRNA ligase [Candidatus Hydrogenedentota bacterium]